MMAEFSNPFDGTRDRVAEPPVGTVIAYEIELGGMPYQYVSFRAGNGIWYTTGSRDGNSTTWFKLCETFIKYNVTSVKFAKTWEELLA